MLYITKMTDFFMLSIVKKFLKRRFGDSVSALSWAQSIELVPVSEQQKLIVSG
jgi:hypothetical protein